MVSVSAQPHTEPAVPLATVGKPRQVDGVRLRCKGRSSIRLLRATEPGREPVYLLGNEVLEAEIFKEALDVAMG